MTDPLVEWYAYFCSVERFSGASAVGPNSVASNTIAALLASTT